MANPSLEAPRSYPGYFVNEQGVCNCFSFDYQSKQGILTRYEGNTVQRYAVLDGSPQNMRLNPREQLWLRMCWSTVQRINRLEAMKDQARVRTNAPRATTQPLPLFASFAPHKNRFGGRMRAWRKARQQQQNS